VYSDDYFNLAIGKFSVTSRCVLTSFSGNSAFGYSSSSDITTGDNNTLIGTFSGSGLTSGSNNIALGYGSLRSPSPTISNNIVIGNNLGNNLNSSYNFLLGVSDSLVLMSGTMGPSNSDKHLFLPDGNLVIKSVNPLLSSYSFSSLNYDRLSIRTSLGITEKECNYYNNRLEIKNLLPSTSSNAFSFIFQNFNEAGQTLFSLNHNASGMVNSAFYEAPTTPRPYAELSGDLKLLGAIRFSDGTSLETSPSGDIAFVSGIAFENQSILSGIFIEGFANERIDMADSYSSPTSGTITDNNHNVYNLYNRDKYSVIHSGDYVIAININNEYRPIWISNASSCNCCVR